MYLRRFTRSLRHRRPLIHNVIARPHSRVFSSAAAATASATSQAPSSAHAQQAIKKVSDVFHKRDQLQQFLQRAAAQVYKSLGENNEIPEEDINAGSTEMLMFKMLWKKVPAVTDLVSLRERVALFGAWEQPISPLFSVEEVATSSSSDCPPSLLLRRKEAPAGRQKLNSSTVLHVHSVGLVAGEAKDIAASVADYYAESAADKILIAATRTIPEASFEDLVSDATSAYNYAREELKVNPRGLTLSGSSAGVSILFQMLMNLEKAEPSSAWRAEKPTNPNAPRLHPKPSHDRALTFFGHSPMLDFTFSSQPWKDAITPSDAASASSSSESEAQSEADAERLVKERERRADPVMFSPDALAVIRDTLVQKYPKEEDRQAMSPAHFSGKELWSLPRMFFMSSANDAARHGVEDLRQHLKEQDPLIEYWLRHEVATSAFHCFSLGGILPESLNAKGHVMTMRF